MADKAETIIPSGADSVELRFADGAWLQLERDTTGRARWDFRGYRPEVPDAVASGVLTAAGAETFAAVSESGTWKTAEEGDELSIPSRARSGSAGGKSTAKKSSGSRKRSGSSSAKSESQSTSEELTGDELHATAKKLNIQGRGSMSADELRAAVAKAQKGS